MVDQIRRNIWAESHSECAGEARQHDATKNMKHLPLAAVRLVDLFLGPRRDPGLPFTCRPLAIKAWGETAAWAVLCRRPDSECDNQVRWTRSPFVHWLASQPPPSSSSSESGTRASTADEATPSAADADSPPRGRVVIPPIISRWIQYIDDL